MFTKLSLSPALALLITNSTPLDFFSLDGLLLITRQFMFLWSFAVVGRMSHFTARYASWIGTTTNQVAWQMASKARPYCSLEGFWMIAIEAVVCIRSTDDAVTLRVESIGTP